MATIEVAAEGKFKQKLAAVDQIALALEFEPFDPADFNASRYPKGDIAAVRGYRLRQLPKVQLRVEIYPLAIGPPYGGDSRWFNIVFWDGRAEGVEFEGIARDKLVNLVSKVRETFGRDFVRAWGMSLPPEIE